MDLQNLNVPFELEMRLITVDTIVFVILYA